MQKLTVVVFLVIGMAGGGYAQQMPVEVKNFMEGYFKSSRAKNSLLRIKSKNPSSDWVQTVQVEDLRVGRVLEVYRTKDITLEAYPDTVPLSEIIESYGQWRILIMAHNKPLYQIVVVNWDDGEIKFLMGGSTYDKDLWGPLLETYPESTGINPILVTTNTDKTPLGFGDDGDWFLYFKQKGPRKVHYIRRKGGARRNAELEAHFSSSIRTLDDSREFVRYKKRGGR
jgi:hypothetical protein